MSDYDNHLWTSYRIRPSEYRVLSDAQGNVCAICGSRDKSPHKRLAVDHDHDSGNVRGLLCSNCNSGLGMFYDSVGLLARAIVYLEEHGKSFNDPIPLREVDSN